MDTRVTFDKTSLYEMPIPRDDLSEIASEPTLETRTQNVVTSLQRNQSSPLVTKQEDKNGKTWYVVSPDARKLLPIFTLGSTRQDHDLETRISTREEIKRPRTA